MCSDWLESVGIAMRVLGLPFTLSQASLLRRDTPAPVSMRNDIGVPLIAHNKV